MQNFDNINWKYTKCIQVMPARMNKILDILEKNGYSRIDPDPGKKLVTVRWKMYDHYFVTSRTGNDITIHVYFVNKYIALPIRYSTTYKFNDENIVRGGQAAPQIYAAFKRKAKKTFDLLLLHRFGGNSCIESARSTRIAAITHQRSRLRHLYVNDGKRGNQ